MFSNKTDDVVFSDHDRSSRNRTEEFSEFSRFFFVQIKDLIQVSLNRPVRLFIDDNQSVAPYLRQEFIRIREHREGDRESIVAALLTRTFRERVIVFVQTKRQCHRMHVTLGLLGLKVGELHGDLSQTQVFIDEKPLVFHDSFFHFQRLETLKQFKNEQIDILLATDLAARGLDIENVKTVSFRHFQIFSLDEQRLCTQLDSSRLDFHGATMRIAQRD